MYVGIDIGGTKTLICLFGNDGSILNEKKFPSPNNYQKFLAELIANLHTLIEQKNVSNMVVATTGKIDYQKNIVTHSGSLNWVNVPLKTDLLKEFGIPVHVDNDCNIAAFGEANDGAGLEYSTVLYITISTGIGGGLVKDKKIVDSMKKTEPGFMIFPFEGELLKWEKFASGKAFVESYGAPASEVNDDRIWQNYAERLVLGFAALLAIIQPDVVVIGGSVGQRLDKFHPYLVNGLKKVKSNMWDIPPIIAAKDPERAAINGCYSLAKNIKS